MAISFRTEIETALSQLILHRRYFDFQKFAFHLAKQKWPELQATEPVHDLGSDGFIMINGSAKLALACSVEGDLAKLRKDCKRLEDVQPTIKTVVFATTRSVTAQTAKDWQKNIRKDFGFNLEQVLGREWLITEAEDVRMRWLCRDYLGMSGLGAEDDANDLLALSAASRKVLGSWREKYVITGAPRIDLVLELQSKERKEHFRVSEFDKEVEAGCRLWIDGEPGGGKTHSITTLAETILSNRGPKLVPILVSLRALSQRGGSLLGYVSSLPAFQEQGLTETRLAQIAAKGRIVFLFNGWNEIAASQWAQTNETIAAIVNQIPSAGIVVVSRPTVVSGIDFSCRNFRLLTLSSREIKSVLKQAFDNGWWSAWAKLRETQGLMELAAVPLFLQELIQELRLNSELPLTRSAILGRMVARAVKEHAVALQDSCLKGNAEKYLKQLAWDMTLNGQLDLSFNQSCKSVAKASEALHVASMIGQKPDPPDVLRELFRFHLLEQDADSIVFVHQLVQEHFAALELADRFRNDDVEVRHATSPSFRDYQWEQSLFLAAECLVSTRDITATSRLINNLSIIDLEAACRLVGSLPSIWPTVRGQLEPLILRLSESKQLSARWIAARCGAWTGQPDFGALVKGALVDGGDLDRSCLDSIPMSLVLKGAGEELADHLISTTNAIQRIQLIRCCEDGDCSHVTNFLIALSSRDPAPEVRRAAFLHLFRCGRYEHFKSFLKEAKITGWGEQMLLILHHSPYGTKARIDRISAFRLAKAHNAQERLGILHTWAELGGSGWQSAVKSEYQVQFDSATPAELVSDTFTVQRFALLELILKSDPVWCSRRLADEMILSDGRDPNRLPVSFGPIYGKEDWWEGITEAADKRRVIDHFIADLQSSANPERFVRSPYKLEPAYSASRLIDCFLCAPRHSELEQRIKMTLREIERAQVIRAIIARTSEPGWDPTQIVELLSPEQAGGGPATRDCLEENDYLSYRAVLLDLSKKLPALSVETAQIWACLATNFGELECAEDAELLVALLKADRERFNQERERRLSALSERRVTGARQQATPIVIPTQWTNWFMAALRRIPGQSCENILSHLLEDADFIGSAGLELVTRAGAHSIQGSGSAFRHPQFDQISKRRTEPKAINAKTRDLLDRIKREVDRHLAQSAGDRSGDSLYRGLYAVAKLTDGSDIQWILEKLERDFQKTFPEDLLETIVLRGLELPGQRIFPLLQRRFTAANSEWKGHDDQGWLVAKALLVLFFSDAPELAVKSLEGEVKWFPRFQLWQLSSAVCWSRHPTCVSWLRDLSIGAQSQENDRYSFLEQAIGQSRALGDIEWLLQLPAQYCAAGKGRFLLKSTQFHRAVAEWASKNPEVLHAIQAKASTAQIVDEAVIWYALLAHLCDEDSLMIILDIAEKFHNRLRILDSIYPHSESKGSLSFSGWLGGRQRFFRSSRFMERLRKLSSSQDLELASSATRAVLWLERERITKGPYTVGERWPKSEAIEEFGGEFWLAHILGPNAGTDNGT